MPEPAAGDAESSPGPERAAAERPAKRPHVEVTRDADKVPEPGEAYDYVGIVMAKSAEGDAVAAILSQRDDVAVLEQPAFWDVRAKDRLEIPYDEVSEQLGYEIDAYSIQHEMYPLRPDGRRRRRADAVLRPDGGDGAPDGLKDHLVEVVGEPRPAPADDRSSRRPRSVFHARASEDEHMRWDFFVRHYDDDEQQRRDSKYVAERDGVL